MDDTVMERVACTNPVREEDLPDPEGGDARRLLEAILASPQAGRRRPSRLSPRLGRMSPARRRLALGGAIVAAAAIVLATPPGQAVIRAAIDEVASWVGGEGGIVSDGVLRAPLRANGIITSAVGDGEGGWFIAGGFTEVNGEQRSHLARIRADGSLDPDWRPQLGGPGPASLTWAKLARAGDRLYLAGTFTAVNGEERGQLVALDATTGAIAGDWNANVYAADAINAIAASDGRVYIGLTGGAVIQGQVRRCVVALDGITGELERSFDARIAPASELRCVSAIVATPGSVIMGGTFTSQESQEPSVIAALDPVTGKQLASFRAPEIVCSECLNGPPVIEAFVISDRRLYVGGNFTAEAASPPLSLLALDLETGALLPDFAPAITHADGSAGDVLALAESENMLYVGGRFRNVDGKPANGFAILAPTGELIPGWKPATSSEYVLALAVSGRQQLAAGASAGT